MSGGSRHTDDEAIIQKETKMSDQTLTSVKVTDLCEREWKIKYYNVPFAIAKIDIMRRGELRWTYNLFIEVYPTAKGVDNNGARASGQAEPAIIDGAKQYKVYPLVEIGSLIKTPFGIYRVEWASKTDHDNIKLFELKES